jgi:hypothetical protein
MLALRYRVGENAVDAERGEQQGGAREDAEQECAEADAGYRVAYPTLHRAQIGGGLSGIDGLNRAAHRGGERGRVAAYERREPFSPQSNSCNATDSSAFTLRPWPLLAGYFTFITMKVRSSCCGASAHHSLTRRAISSRISSTDICDVSASTPLTLASPNSSPLTSSASDSPSV